MSRLLCPALVLTFLIALTVPSITFYILIKDYWAEVSALRRDLLFCQLGSTLPPLPPLTLDLIPSPPPTTTIPTNTPPPLPQPLVGTAMPQGSLLPPSPPVVSPPSLLSSPSSGSQGEGDTAGGTRPPRSIEKVMMGDQSSEGTLANEDYHDLLERQVRELRARVAACRSCLAKPQRKVASCGGGKAWRDHRRRHRLLRRQEKMRRRQNRRKKKNRDKMLSASPTTTTTTTTTTPPTTTTTTTTPTTSYYDHTPGRDTLLADVGYSNDYRSEQQQQHRARETHRMSTDFRRGFNQKISRMDEALMQFTDTQASFCKELRDNLGERLEKRGLELEALSSQITALVRTSTAQITALEKVASDQMYAGQASIEKTLSITQAIRDSQLRAIRDYHKSTFLPVAAAVATHLTDQAAGLTAMGVTLITKVEMLQDVYLTYATRQADTLKKLSQEVAMFEAKHSNLVTRSRDHANHLHHSAENFVREIQTRVNNVVKELVLMRLQSQNYVTASNDTHTDMDFSLNKTQGAVETLSQGLRRRLDNATHLEQDFRKVFKRQTDQFTARVESGVSEALVSNHASISQVEEGELDTRVFVGTATAAWNELYLNQEAELRKEADHLTQTLQSHTHHTQNVLAGMRSVAETHEQVLEEQRGDFQRFIRKRQDALDNQCSAIGDWALLMSTELRRRDHDLHRFLSEDLQFASVTVVEDDEGYLVSRLPDGSLLYQSSASRPPQGRSPHSRTPPPNTTYQLEGTAYSAGPTEPDLHSSPQRPHLENSTRPSLTPDPAALTQHSTGPSLTQHSTSPSLTQDPAALTQHGTDTTDHQNSGNRERMDSGNGQERNSARTHQRVHEEMDSETSQETNKVTLTADLEDMGSGSDQESNSAIIATRDRSSILETDNNINASINKSNSMPSENRDITDSEVNKVNIQPIEMRKQEDHERENAKLDAIDGSGDGENTNTIPISFSQILQPLRLISIKGEVESPDETATSPRQNDGPKVPRCARKKCGSQGSSQTPSLIDEEDGDQSVRNLRRILKEAQATVKKFQIDFQQEGASKNANKSSSKWASLDIGEVSTEVHLNITQGMANHTIDDCENDDDNDQGDIEESQDNIYQGHKVRHHHGSGGNRKHSNNQEEREQEKNENEETSTQASDHLSQTSTSSPMITPLYPNLLSSSPFPSASPSNLPVSSLSSSPHTSASLSRPSQPTHSSIPSLSVPFPHSPLSSYTSSQPHRPTLTLWDTWETLLQAQIQGNSRDIEDSTHQSTLERVDGGDDRESSKKSRKKAKEKKKRRKDKREKKRRERNETTASGVEE